MPFTYDNKRVGWNNVKVRLDRAVADENWREIFSGLQVIHLTSPCSDHVPIVLHFYADQNTQIKTKCLHYEIFWEREAELPQVVEDQWISSGDKANLSDINKALGRVMLNLHSWSKRKCKNVGREIENVWKELAAATLSNADSGSVRRLSDKLHKLLYREEMLWLQCSRINWLKEGDCNTRFFHSTAVWRAKKNRISMLRDVDGNVKTSIPVLEIWRQTISRICFLLIVLWIIQR